MCSLLRQVAKVVDYIAHTDSLLHTRPSGRQEVFEENYFQEPFFSLLSDAVYPVFSAFFELETRPRSQTLIKVLSLQRRGGLFLMIGFLLASV